MVRDKKFLIFKKECERLIKEWGLDDWNVVFEISKDCSISLYAYLDSNIANGTAAVFYNPIGHKDKGIDEVIDSARHEMIHLLLAKIVGLGYSRFASKQELDREEEHVVNKLNKILFGK